jgi:SNF2 family DNA or RNA helicase
MITLGAHQIAAVREAVAAYRDRDRRYAFIAHGVGTGKSFTSAAIASNIAPLIKARLGGSVDWRVLKQPVTWLFTVAKAKQQQRTELLRYFTRDEIIVIQGTPEERHNQLYMVGYSRPTVVIMNYDQMRIHWKELVASLKECDILILDESDLIQNYESIRSVIARALALKAHYRILTTATPIQNSVYGLYPQLQACDPTDGRLRRIVADGETIELVVPGRSEFWGRPADFARRYLTHDTSGRVVGTRNAQELHLRLEEFGVSVLDTEDVVTLDVMEPAYFDTPLTPEAAELYEKLKRGIVAWVEANETSYRRGDTATRASIKQTLLTQINYARRIPALSPRNFVRLVLRNQARTNGGPTPLTNIDASELERFDGSLLGGNTKAEWLVRYLQTKWADPSRPGGVLVYSEYTDALDEVEAYLRRYYSNIAFGRIDGTRSRRQIEDARQGVLNGHYRLCLVSDCGGRSLNLQTLTECVILTPPWTYTQVAQVFGRIKRRGQNNPIRLVWPIATDTIERHVLQRLVQKGKDTESILHGQHSRKADPLMGIESLYEVIGWL